MVDIRHGLIFTFADKIKSRRTGMLPKKVRKKVIKLVNQCVDAGDGNCSRVVDYLDAKWPAGEDMIVPLPSPPFETDPLSDLSKELTKADKKAAKKAAKKDDTLDSFPEANAICSKGDTILVKAGNGRPKRATVLAVSAKSGNIKCMLIAKQEEIIVNAEQFKGLTK